MNMPLVANAIDPGQDLAQWASNGDRAALERVLAAAADPAYDQAVRLLGRAADADDATQEALVQLVRSAARYDPARPFRPWLARLVHVACCRLLRSDRRRRRHEAAVTPPTENEAPMDPDQVRSAVLDLPEPLRAVVELHYFAGLSQAEAASALGIGEGACAMRLSRARDRLRELLRRRGIGTASATALALLAAAPAQAAPPTVAAHVAVQAAAGTLPTTTIPLTALQTGVWFMATHPIAATAIALGLIAAVCTPFAMQAGEAAPPAPRPAVVPAPAPAVTWSAPARALLPYLDPDAPLRMAMDLQTLRPQLMKTKPLSMLDDPRMTDIDAILEASARITFESMSDDDWFWLELSTSMVGYGGGCVLSARDCSTGRDAQRAVVINRLLIAADAGGEAEHLAEVIRSTQLAKRGVQPPPPAIGPFMGLIFERIGQEAAIVGRDHDRFAVANVAWLTKRVAAPAAAQPPAHAWFRYDAGALLARYAALSQGADPALVGAVLGPQWKSMKPVIEGTIAVREADIVGSVRVTGSGPCSPMVPLTLLMGGTAELPFSYLASWPMRQPRMAIPASADRVASLTIGLAPPAQTTSFAVQAAAATQAGQITPAQASDLFASALSGDLAVEVRQGAPLPRVAMVLGVHAGVDPTAVLQYAAAAFGLTAVAGSQPQTCSGFVAGGSLSITAGADRLVATWNAEIADWPGIATAKAPAAAPACALTVDLPAIVRGWYPLLAAVFVPPEQRALVPPQAVLIAHLPVYSLSWEATPDGCRIDERGLPLATILTAAAAIRTVAEADPERETERGLRDQQPAPAPAPPSAPLF